MRLLFCFLVAACGFFSASSVHAQDFQRHWALGAGLGAANTVNDLAPTLHPANTRFGAQLGAEYYFQDFLSWRTDLTMARLVSSDSLFSDQPYRLERGAEMASWVLGLQSGLSYHFLPFRTGRRTPERAWTPYVFAGLALHYVNGASSVPSGATGGQGQGGVPLEFSASGFTGSLPLAVGAKFKLSYYWDFGLELAMHRLFTDHMDALPLQGDYALNQPSNSQDRDRYYYLGFSFKRHFYTLRCPTCTPRNKRG